MSDIIRISMPGKPEYTQALRLAIGSLACQQAFNVEQVEDLKLAVSEACKLVTCHGVDLRPDVYNMTVEMYDSAMQITVTDEGCNFALEKKDRFCENCPGDGNLSLLVVKSLVDDVKVIKNDLGQRTIIMVKNR